MFAKVLIGAYSISIAIVIASCSSDFEILQRPISFSEQRFQLTNLYMKEHYGLIQKNIYIVPKVIVLHWTGIDSADSTFKLFNMETLRGTRPDLQQAGNVNVSAHYLVDRDGTVFQLMPDTLMARHCIGINYCSIGIENVGGTADSEDLTEDQLEANIKLVSFLVKKHPTIEYLIGHYEYREFENHFLWREIDPDYRTLKFDPGKKFMNRIRNELAWLNLKGVQEIRAEKLRYK